MSGTSHSAKRFLMAIAVAVVVGVTYVASATGSGAQAESTAPQLAALKKQVAALSKKVRTVQADLNSVAYAYAHCSLHSTIGVSRRGDAVNGTYGYSFTPWAGGQSTFGAALDLDPSGSPMYTLTPFNILDANCNQLVGQALRRNAASVFAQNFAQKP